MSNSEENRLDRLESLAENTLTELREIKSGLQEIRLGLQEIKLGLQETNQGLKETRAIANSNAKSIEALTNSLAESKKEWEKDRRGLYQLLGQLTRSRSDFYEVQSDFYNRFDKEERQSRMVEILDRYLPPENPANS
jgi:septal ring factor EnvC (AmiA/AmiB activator)